jgi:hypothetical protein
MIFFFWDTNGSPPLSLITNHFRFFNFLLLRVGDLSPRTLSLSLEDASLSWLFVLARVHVFQHLFFIFSCLCVCFVVCILFQIKTSSLKALSLSLSLSLGRSCCLRTTTTTRTAMTERRRRREKKAASWGWCWRGDSWCTWRRGSLKFGGQQCKSKMFLSYFSRFVLLLRRYSRYAFALGATAIAIGAIVFNTNRRIE